MLAMNLPQSCFQVRLPFLSTIAALLVALPAVTGCGSGSYNEKMDRRISELKREAPFTALSAPTEIPGTPVTLRVPKILSRFATLDTEDPSSPTKKISPERVKPMMLKVPGVFCVYDGEAELPENKKAPMACQIAVLSKAEPQVAALPAMLDAGVKMAFPGKSLEWEMVNAETPWKMIRLEGDQLFDVTTNDGSAPQFTKLPAITEIWSHENDHYQVLLIFKIPQEAEDKYKLMELARLTAGTISVGAPPAEEAKPDKG
jgi:hypothetical protein